MTRTAASKLSTEHGSTEHGPSRPRRPGLRGVLALCLVLPGAAAGQDYVPGAGSVEGRLARVERLLDNRGLLDLLGEVEKLNREIRRLRGEMEVQRHGMDRQSARQERLYNDVEARLEAIERGAAQPPTTDGAAQAPAGAPTAPATPSVANVPASGAEPGASQTADSQPDDESARGATPDIGAIRSEVPGSAPLTVAATQPPSEDASYQSAFDLLKIGQYDKSITAFGDFVTRFPGSPHADNAQYWLAEAYYVTHRYEPAISEYNKLVGSYPESQKLTHALLKVGYSYHELGKIPEAKASLEDLKLRYPGTTAARLADERLQRIRLEHR
ncbi:MAG: tol-pal system protein YbgF [Gammaproteobacteria bacterium]